jgi:hypothetical protein
VLLVFCNPVNGYCRRFEILTDGSLESRGTGTRAMSPPAHPSGTTTAAEAKAAKRKVMRNLVCMIAFVVVEKLG